MTRNAGELAQYLGANLVGDARAEISGAANPEDASPQDLVYVEAAKYLASAAKSRAIALLAKPGTKLTGKTVLEVANPKLAFAKAAAWLMPPTKPEPGVHATSVVASSARIAKSATIGAYVVIEDGSTIGEGTWVEPFCFVGKDSSVGANCRLHPHVTLYAGAVLRDRVELHSGAVVGGDGFGYVFGEGRHWKFPQTGRVVLEDDVEIGCNTAVDRGSLGTTRIGAGAKIDNLVQVAHNVQIGENTILVSQTGISGSTTLGKNVLVGGQAGFGDHAVVEDGAIIGGQAGILPGKVVRSGQVVWGTPCRPLHKFKEQHAWSARLPELARRLKALEERVGKSGPSNS
jgi:UDP-3-O-[3-hydroxymyristoyl] glucosamine N-acyltransferase